MTPGERARKVRLNQAGAHVYAEIEAAIAEAVAEERAACVRAVGRADPERPEFDKAIDRLANRLDATPAPAAQEQEEQP